MLAHIAYVARFWHTADEAYVGFRFARDLATGAGLPAGDGSSDIVTALGSPLWAVAAAPFEWLGADVATGANLVSVVAACCLLLLVRRALLRHVEVAPTLAALATGILALSPPFTVWATSGLETMLFALLLFVAFERIVLSRGERAGIAGGLAALGVCLVRPEGTAWAATILVLGGVGRLLDARRHDSPLPRALRPSVRRTLAPVLVALAIALPGSLLYAWARASWPELGPSAPVAPLDLATLRLGLSYVAAFALATLVPPLLLLGAPAALRRRPEHALPALLLCVGLVAHAVVVGGDDLAFGRLLLPSLPIAVLLFGAWLDDLGSRYGAPAPAALAIGALLVGLLPAHDVNVFPRSVRAALHFRTDATRVRTELQQWAHTVRTTRRRTELGRAMGVHAEPGSTWTTSPVGAAGYHSGLSVFDVGDPVDTGARPPGGNGRGHGAAADPNDSTAEDRSPAIARALARRPTYLFAALVDEGAPLPEDFVALARDREVRARYLPELTRVVGEQQLLWIRQPDRDDDVAAAWRAIRPRVAEAEPRAPAR